MHKRTFHLGPNWWLVTATGVVVAAMHLVILFLWLNNVRVVTVPKRPDINLEFMAPKLVTSKTQTPPAQDALPAGAPQRPPKVLVEPAAPAPQPSETAALMSPAAAPTPAPTALVPTRTAEPAGDPSSARTADADYKAAELNNPQPLYPMIAVRQEAQGRVLLLVEVLADGRVGRVTLEQSSGHAILDTSAMNTVRLWRFKPAVKDGVFHAQTIRIPIDFNLTGSR